MRDTWIGEIGLGAREISLCRARLDDGRLGVTACSENSMVVLVADDVPDGALAGAARHLEEQHQDDDGVALCAQPHCDAADRFRPAAPERQASG
jgi:hypothetical protein